MKESLRGKESKMLNGKMRDSTRREFLKGAAAAVISGPCIISCAAPRAYKHVAPSERVTMGCIGVGGRGTAVMKAFLKQPDAQVVAVCDPFKDRREAVRDLVDSYYDQKLCTAYNDFRDLVARSDIDAVLIATQDHWHVLHAIAAAETGKDMYVEKPLSLTIAEGRALCDAVARHERIFLHGTQQRSSDQFRFACELVRNGRIGELHTIEVGSPASGELEDQPEMPIPEGFDYNMWLGPAPWKPYTEKRCITPHWYFISDYTIGFVAGWGVHHIDIAQWGNDSERSGPVEIEGTGVFPKGGLCDTATAWEIEMKYANGVKLIFTDNNKCKQGARFEGTEGWVHVNRQGLEAHPKSLLESVIGPNETHLYESKHHQRNFLDCVKTRKETICPVEVAHRTTTICHLSQIAMLLERKLRWDPRNERFIDDPEANHMMSKAMRSPWRL